MALAEAEDWDVIESKICLPNAFTQGSNSIWPTAANKVRPECVLGGRLVARLYGWMAIFCILHDIRFMDHIYGAHLWKAPKERDCPAQLPTPPVHHRPGMSNAVNNGTKAKRQKHSIIIKLKSVYLCTLVATPAAPPAAPATATATAFE